jgi:hypothetical protein
MRALARGRLRAVAPSCVLQPCHLPRRSVPSVKSVKIPPAPLPPPPPLYHYHSTSTDREACARGEGGRRVEKSPTSPPSPTRASSIVNGHSSFRGRSSWNFSPGGDLTHRYKVLTAGDAAAASATPLPRSSPSYPQPPRPHTLCLQGMA